MHKELGPGFLEKIYSKALMIQFENEHIKFEYEKEFNVYFKNKLAGNLDVTFLLRIM